jgi:hypothetical protein
MPPKVKKLEKEAISAVAKAMQNGSSLAGKMLQTMAETAKDKGKVAKKVTPKKQTPKKT